MNWLDHLSSYLVVSVGLLIVAGVFALRSDAAVTQVSLFNAQVIQRSFTEQLQVDLDNLGIGRPPGADAMVELTDDRFAFYTAIDTVGTGALVTYEKGEVRDGVFTVRRLVGGVRVGGAEEVTRMDIALRDAAGQPAAALADAREVEVALQRRAPFQREDDHAGAIETTGWTTRVRPFALRYPY